MLKKLMALLMALFTVMAFAAVDVNSGDATQLDSIKGVGPTIAGKIVAERKNGNFKDWDDFVKRISGVGEKSAAKLSEAGLTVNGTSFKGLVPKADAKTMSKPAAATTTATPAAKPTPASTAAATPAPAAKPTDTKAAATPMTAAESKAAAKKEKEDAATAKKQAKAEKAAAAKQAKEDKAAAKKAGDDKAKPAAAKASEPAKK